MELEDKERSMNRGGFLGLKRFSETYEQETQRRAGRARKQSRIDKMFDLYFDNFPVQQWEAKLYPKIGVLFYKHLVPNNGTVVNRLLRKPKLNTNSQEALDRRIALTKKGEKDHMLGIPLLYAVATTAAEFTSLHHPTLTLPIFALTTAAQVPLNVFPIMLQRFNRYLATEKQQRLAKK